MMKVKIVDGQLHYWIWNNRVFEFAKGKDVGWDGLEM